MVVDLDAIGRWTATQHGLVSRAQCLAAGTSPTWLEHRLATGRWHVVHPGVYQSQPGRDDWLTRAGAAVLVAGRGAALSHDSAARSFGLDRPERPVVVSIPAGRVATAPPGIRVVRRARLVVPDETVWPPRTSIVDAVLDIADEGSADEAIAVVAEACRRHLTWDVALAEALARRRRHRWRVLLEEALLEVGSGAESTFEVRYFRDVERAHALPRGRRQAPTGGGRRHHDSGYDALRVLVELDGRRWHDAPRRRRADDQRDLGTAIEGWLTVRAGWVDVAVTPCAYAVQLATLFRSRGWSGSPKPCRRVDCDVRRAATEGP